MIKEPFIAHSELTNEIYIVVGKEKYRVTDQAIKAVKAIKAIEQEPVLDKIRAEIEQLPTSIEYPDIEYVYGVTKKQLLGIIDKYKAEIKPQESEDKDSEHKEPSSKEKEINIAKELLSILSKTT